MTETKETTEKTLRGDAPRKPLSLKRTVESGHVRQSFSHGRSKSVVVEKKKKRTISGARRGRGGADAAERRPEAERLLAEVMPASPAACRPTSSTRAVARSRLAKERAEAAASASAPAWRRCGPSPSRSPPASEPAPAPMAKPQVAERSRRRDAGAGRWLPEAEARADEKAKAAEPRRRASSRSPRRSGRAAELEPEVEEDARGKKKGAKPAKTPVKIGEERRERIKLTINNAFDEAQRERSLASLKRQREREKLRQAGVVQPRDKVMREVIIPEVITIQELANRMTERSVDVIKLLMAQGAMHKINDVIDADTAELIVREFGHTPKRVSEADVEEGFIGQTDTDEDLRAARAGRHHHGPRRPRQDVAARRHPPDQRGGRRGRRHHPAHRRLSGDDAQTARRSPSSTRRATRRSPPCARAAPRSPTSWCWWWPPTTASCRRRWRPSTTPRPPACR